MKFTIGYINHNKEVFDRCLGPSLSALRGDFEVISTTDEKFPAENYNHILDESTNEWIILTHQDISFSPDLLEKIELTIKTLDEANIKYSALGLVGRDYDSESYTVHWSTVDKIYRLETCDCCFIAIPKSNSIRFDEENFDEYHLYVEDYCMAANQLGGIYTIGGINGAESKLIDSSKLPLSYMLHHSATVNERGCAWGRYYEYKERLWKKWNKKVKTT